MILTPVLAEPYAQQMILSSLDGDKCHRVWWWAKTVIRRVLWWSLRQAYPHTLVVDPHLVGVEKLTEQVELCVWDLESFPTPSIEECECGYVILRVLCSLPFCGSDLFMCICNKAAQGVRWLKRMKLSTWLIEIIEYCTLTISTKVLPQIWWNVLWTWSMICLMMRSAEVKEYDRKAQNSQQHWKMGKHEQDDTWKTYYR